MFETHMHSLCQLHPLSSLGYCGDQSLLPWPSLFLHECNDQVAVTHQQDPTRALLTCDLQPQVQSQEQSLSLCLIIGGGRSSKEASLCPQQLPFGGEHERPGSP